MNFFDPTYPDIDYDTYYEDHKIPALNGQELWELSLRHLERNVVEDNIRISLVGFHPNNGSPQVAAQLGAITANYFKKTVEVMYLDTNPEALDALTTQDEFRPRPATAKRSKAALSYSVQAADYSRTLPDTDIAILDGTLNFCDEGSLKITLQRLAQSIKKTNGAIICRADLPRTIMEQYAYRLRDLAFMQQRGYRAYLAYHSLWRVSQIATTCGLEWDYIPASPINESNWYLVMKTGITGGHAKRVREQSQTNSFVPRANIGFAGI